MRAYRAGAGESQAVPKGRSSGRRAAPEPRGGREAPAPVGSGRALPGVPPGRTSIKSKGRSGPPLAIAYFFLFGRCVSAEAAAVLAAGEDLGSRRTFEAAEAPLALVTSEFDLRAILFTPRCPQATSKSWWQTCGVSRHALIPSLVRRLACSSTRMGRDFVFPQRARLWRDGRGAKLQLRAPTSICQLHPLVPPQVLHFMQVPLRTSV